MSIKRPVHPLLIALPLAAFAVTLGALLAHAATGDVVWYRVALFANLGGLAVAVLSTLAGMVDAANLPAFTVAREAGFRHVAFSALGLMLFAATAMVIFNRYEGHHMLGDVAPLALGALGLYVLFGGRPGGIVSGPGGIVSGVIKGETTLPFGATPGERPGAGLAQTPPPRPRTPPAQKARPSEKHAIGTSGTKLPRVLGRYTLLEHLGQGGMADVYIAASYGAQGFRRTFVLKRIRPELAQDKAAVGHFVDEACLQAGLVHSNIVPVFDFGIVDGEYFMTEEYVLGRDLARLTERHAEQNTQPFDPRLAFYVARETLQALDYAHTRQDKEGRPLAIVHRDVSPGNIMVSLAGDVKLFDFGIMKSNKRISQTQFGMVKGNANFMSPEQARGQEVDWRSDLFSLGLVLYYCLAGRLLYQGENDLELIHLAASGPSEADWEEIRKLPQPAPEILTRALAVDRNDRFQSAAEFSQALAPYVRHARSETADLMQTLFGEDLRREAA